MDLSFFRALERNNSKKPFPSTIDELIRNVEETFWDFDPRTIEKGFVTLALVCNEIIRHHGDNTYPKPHIGKDAYLRRHGHLPLEIQASPDVLEWSSMEMDPDNEPEQETDSDDELEAGVQGD